MLPSLFDIGALPYDLLTWQEPWRAHCREVARTWAPAGQACRVLDLGTGPAVSAVEAARERPGDRLVGLDISAPMLRRARRRLVREGKLADRVWLVRADGRELPFHSAMFDAVTGHSFLYLVPSRERALAEAARVLKPGGRVVFLEPRAAPGDGRWQKLRTDAANVLASAQESAHNGLAMALWRIVSAVRGRFSESELRGVLAGSGLHEVRVEPTLHGLGWLVTGSRL